MYSSLTIRRFRCFKDLPIVGLRRVNLVTGVNNSGKTSLLEALFLLVGGFNPMLPLRLNTLRGMDTVVANSDEQWGWLFHNHDAAQTIEINATDTDGGEDGLRLHLGSPQEFERLIKGLGQQELPIEVSGPVPVLPKGAEVPSTRPAVELYDLILEFREHRGRTVISRASLGSDGRIRLDQTKQNGFRPGAFLATRIRAAAEDADRLSRLKRQKREQQVVAALKAVEPATEDLTILVQGGESVIHAELSGLGLVPIPMLGEGLGRLLSLTLAILTTPGGLVLVDELENGIHHAALKGVWKGIAIATKEARTQFVATTHSQECIEAAHETFAGLPDYDLSVIQLFRLPTGIEGRALGKHLVDAAVEGNLDLR
jgi:hypothetical protein